MKSIFLFLEQQTAGIILLLALFITIALGFLDHFIGSELSSAIFYIIPIAIASWFGNRNSGILVCGLSAIIWLLTDITSGREYSHSATIYWNAFARLCMFLLISHLFSSFRERLRIEEAAADTDSLTGIANNRGFYENLDSIATYARRYRHTITVVYLDLDNFKTVNDTSGHSEGDELLLTVAQILDTQMRSTDIAARLGGDEFAVLLPETDYAAANAAFSNTQHHLQEAMRIHNWPVTFSIGMVTFEQIPESPRDMVKIVDELMYSVKKNQKNALSHITWNGI